MLRRLRVPGDAAPAFSTILRTVHAALIGGPHLSRFRAGAEQRRDCAGWLCPTVADALPAFSSVARAADNVGCEPPQPRFQLSADKRLIIGTTSKGASAPFRVYRPCFGGLNRFRASSAIGVPLSASRSW